MAKFDKSHVVKTMLENLPTESEAQAMGYESLLMYKQMHLAFIDLLDTLIDTEGNFRAAPLTDVIDKTAMAMMHRLTANIPEEDHGPIKVMLLKSLVTTIAGALGASFIDITKELEEIEPTDFSFDTAKKTEPNEGGGGNETLH